MCGGNVCSCIGHSIARKKGKKEDVFMVVFKKER